MKKAVRAFLVIWAICLVLFHQIVFLIPLQRSAGFFLGYGFILAAFAGQLACGLVALKESNLQKLFYKIPLITVSYLGLALMLVLGSICMAIPGVPQWLGAVVCLAVLAVTAIAVVTAGTAGQIVSDADRALQAETAFIRDLTVQAQGLVQRAGAPMLQKQCQKVYEALRYSDPVSDSRLAQQEQQIRQAFGLLEDAVMADDLNETESCAKELLVLIGQRNDQCKALKK